MSAIQISNNLTTRALGVSATAAGITWTLDYNQNILSGAAAEFVRIDNIGSTTAFVNIANNNSVTATIPGSSVVGNTFPVAPNSSVTVQLFNQSGVASSAFNDGDGYCYITALTVEGTTILVFTPVQTV